MQLKAGDYLFMEGSFDDHLYIVKKGFLTAERREHGMIQVQWAFEPGSLIGEGSLLENRPHTHAVKASIDSELIVLEQSELKQSLAKSPNWIVYLVVLERQKKNMLNIIGFERYLAFFLFFRKSRRIEFLM